MESKGINYSDGDTIVGLVLVNFMFAAFYFLIIPIIVVALIGYGVYKLGIKVSNIERQKNAKSV